MKTICSGIWRTCKHSKEGILLVRDLCTEFNIWNTNLWSSLLSQIMKFNFLKVIALGSLDRNFEYIMKFQEQFFYLFFSQSPTYRQQVFNNSFLHANFLISYENFVLKELEKTLLVLCSQPQIWTCSQFISAWNMLLQSPFSSLLPPVSG